MNYTMQQLIHKQILCRLGKHEAVMLIQEYTIQSLSPSSIPGHLELAGSIEKGKQVCRWCDKFLGDI